MTPIQLAVTLTRLLGIYCLILAASELYEPLYLIAALADADPDADLYWATGVSSIGPSCLLLVMGVVLWMASRPIAQRIVGAPAPEATPGENLKADDFAAIAFAVAGLLIISGSLPGLARISSLVVETSLDEVEDRPFTVWPYLVADGLPMLLGLALFLGTRPIVRAWRWLQTVGTPNHAKRPAP